MAGKQKISAVQMEAYIRENGGLYSRTAREIQKKLGIPITRQEVAQWAKNHPTVIDDINDQTFDLVQEGLQSFMRGGDKIPKTLQLRAIEIFIKYKGKQYGFVEHIENDILTKHNIKIKVV